ncbi:MAG: membrane protein insertase YidC [Kiritimatiellia bacterium]
MNKSDIAIIVLLFLLLLGWGFWNSGRENQAPLRPATAEKAVETTGEDAEDPGRFGADPGAGAGERGLRAAGEKRKEKDEHPEPERSNLIEEKYGLTDEGHGLPEKTVVFGSDRSRFTVSSRGGGIVGAELQEYRAGLEEDSGPLRLEFSAGPALSLVDFPGFTTNNDFTVSRDSSGRMVMIVRESGGFKLERTFIVTNGYKLIVTDTFTNTGDEPRAVPPYGMSLGPMSTIETQSKQSRRFSYLGVDSLPAGGGRDVIHWVKKGPKDDKASLAERFRKKGKRGGFACFKPGLDEPLPHSVSFTRTNATDWIAAKNKFFVQLMSAAEPAAALRVSARRNVPETEDPRKRGTWMASAVLDSVRAEMIFDEALLQPGESFKRTAQCYIGPKKYSLLKDLGKRQDEVMLYAWWDWWRGLCIIMLWTLNGIHSFMPNYGAAIIILTFIVRVLFWPVTHKSTESMKKMQKLQPELTALREKHKGDPQKLQRATMALYKEHGVNPMAGCLPILVQMPVFIALFTVLRSAVELRFASFLWIRDLSEPEALFAGTALFEKLPLIDSLNILPLLMAVTMYWQQKLTTAGGDSQQQKMMTIMPVVLLFVLYSMPSALLLYWTVSQCLSIAQVLLQRRREASAS